MLNHKSQSIPPVIVLGNDEQHSGRISRLMKRMFLKHQIAARLAHLSSDALMCDDRTLDPKRYENCSVAISPHDVLQHGKGASTSSGGYLSGQAHQLEGNSMSMV